MLNKLLFLVIVAVIVGCNSEEKMNNTSIKDDFISFAKEFEINASKAYFEVGDAYFKASINSTDENWNIVAENDMKFNAIYSDTNAFNNAKYFHENDLGDSLLNRHAEVLYLNLLSKQLPVEKLNEISKMQTEIENKFSNFRAEVAGKKYDDNQIEEILKTSKNSQELKSVWEAHKEIGNLVESDILKMVGLRNAMAKDLGFDNFHSMSLELSEQDPEMIEALFDELDVLTRDAYADLKKEIDKSLASQYGISESELMPWHYQNRFFQEAPMIYNLDLDKYYEGKDLVEITDNYFEGIGLPITQILQRSDLYPKENKNQHAYCYNIDRNKKDIRVLCNVVDNARWAETMLHEFGHAVYEEYYESVLPWSLKVPAHIFVTEAVAMFFGRLPGQASWMASNGIIDENEKQEIQETAQKIQKLQMLVFSRWVQVVYRFEKEMYANPEQDLNKLWWELVEKYQMMKKPEGRDMPDWATKIHIASFPCYYHNYLMGEILASQFHYYLANKLNQDPDGELSFTGNTEIGKIFREELFFYGSSVHWDVLIERMTGEKLTAKYYSKQFVN